MALVCNVGNVIFVYLISIFDCNLHVHALGLIAYDTCHSNSLNTSVIFV